MTRWLHPIRLLGLAWLIICTTYAQGPPVKHRILIVLDASGSMGELWGNQSKYQIALQVLARVIDSVQRVHPNVEFGLRLLGHQSPRAQRNCQDTRLELPFGQHPPSAILALAQRYQPQGWTPIAYALQQAMKDFQEAPTSTDQPTLNGIILITDGKETCEGDPCTIVQELFRRRISIKPFIVGMGVKDTFLRKHYRCMEGYYSANHRGAVARAIQASVERILNRTTFQLFLLNAQGKPHETNIAFTLVDHETGKPIASYVHRLGKNHLPDTLEIDPRGVYDLILHTTPPLRKTSIVFSAGKHNIISMSCLLATVQFQMPIARPDQYQVLVRNAQGQPVYLAHVGHQFRLVAGTYTFEVLTTPVLTYRDVHLYGGTTRTFRLPPPIPITLSAQTEDLLIAIYDITTPNKVQNLGQWHLKRHTSRTLRLLPGTYLILYRPIHAFSMETSQYRILRLTPGKTYTLQL